MAMGLANLLRPEPFKCKRKGDSEQLMQDFIEYRDKMEKFYTAAQLLSHGHRSAWTPVCSPTTWAAV